MLLQWIQTKSTWAATWQNQQNHFAPSEDSNQPGHPPSLIRVFAVRMKKPWALSYLLSAQRRLWLDRADAQADLSLRWAHSHFVGCVVSWLILILCFYSYNPERLHGDTGVGGGGGWGGGNCPDFLVGMCDWSLRNMSHSYNLERLIFRLIFKIDTYAFLLKYHTHLYTIIRAVCHSTCSVRNAFGHLIREPHYFQTLGPLIMTLDHCPLTTDQWPLILDSDQWPLTNDPWPLTSDPRPLTTDPWLWPLIMTLDHLPLTTYSWRLTCDSWPWPMTRDPWPVTVTPDLWPWPLITDPSPVTFDHWALTDQWTLTSDIWPVTLDHWSLTSDQKRWL